MDGSQVNATEPHHWDVNIVSGNGLVPSGNKPLPEPMFTQICVCHHLVSLGHNELTWLRQNGQHFPDDIFKFPCFNENHCIAIEVSVKFVSKSYINNKSSLIQLICRNRQQGIIWTNAYLLWSGSSKENYFVNEICKKTSIVFRPKYVEPIKTQSQLGFSLFSKYLKRNKYTYFVWTWKVGHPVSAPHTSGICLVLWSIVELFFIIIFHYYQCFSLLFIIVIVIIIINFIVIIVMFYHHRRRRRHRHRHH